MLRPDPERAVVLLELTQVHHAAHVFQRGAVAELLAEGEAEVSHLEGVDPAELQSRAHLVDSLRCGSFRPLLRQETSEMIDAVQLCVA